MKVQIKTYIIISLALIFSFSSCIKKEFEEPDIISSCNTNSSLKANVSIFDIQKLYNTGKLDTVKELVMTFPKDSDYVLEAIVVSSDEYGNFYKEIYISDSTGAMKISVDGTNLYNDFNQGQTVMIKLSGLNMEKDDKTAMYVLGMGLYENTTIGRLPVTLLKNYVFRNSCPKEITTTTVNIGSIYDIYLGKYVELKDVQFVDKDTLTTYADAVHLATLNRELENCTGATLIVRTSGYAKFAGDSIPRGKGSVKGIMTKYGSDYQLSIVNVKDINLTDARCN